MFDTIKYKIDDYLVSLQIKRLKKQYPTWDYNNWSGDLEFIWGVKAWDDLTPSDICIRTMNDIDIVYNHKTKKYSLSIETAYGFESNEGLVNYLEGLLKHFEAYMDLKRYNKTDIPLFYMSDTVIDCRSESIEELYGKFRLFVSGWKSVIEESKKEVK